MDRMMKQVWVVDSKAAGRFAREIRTAHHIAFLEYHEEIYKSNIQAETRETQHG